MNTERREDLRSGGRFFQLLLASHELVYKVIHHTCTGEDMRFRLSTEVIHHTCTGEDMRILTCTHTKIPDAHHQLRISYEIGKVVLNTCVANDADIAVGWEILFTSLAVRPAGDRISPPVLTHCTSMR